MQALTQWCKGVKIAHKFKFLDLKCSLFQFFVISKLLRLKNQCPKFINFKFSEIWIYFKFVCSKILIYKFLDHFFSFFFKLQNAKIETSEIKILEFCVILTVFTSENVEVTVCERSSYKNYMNNLRCRILWMLREFHLLRYYPNTFATWVLRN